MVWIPVLLVSFIFFAYDVWVTRKNGGFLSRQGLTGYEIARHVLDASGLSQITVDAIGPGDKEIRRGIRQLYLEKKIYEGKNLRAMALAAREAVFLIGVPHSFLPLDLKKRAAELSAYAVLGGWLMFAAGFGIGRLSFLRMGSLAVFVSVFLMAALSLPAELEASERALDHLKGSRYFEVGELARLRSLLNALRFSGLAQIFNVPLEFASGLRRKRFHGL